MKVYCLVDCINYKETRDFFINGYHLTGVYDTREKAEEVHAKYTKDIERFKELVKKPRNERTKEEMIEINQLSAMDWIDDEFMILEWEVE